MNKIRIQGLRTICWKIQRSFENASFELTIRRTMYRDFPMTNVVFVDVHVEASKIKQKNKKSQQKW